MLLFFIINARLLLICVLIFSKSISRPFSSNKFSIICCVFSGGMSFFINLFFMLFNSYSSLNGFSAFNIFNKIVLIFSFKLFINKWQLSSNSFCNIFPNKLISVSSLENVLIPFIIFVAHSITIFFKPYFWFKYIYIYSSIVCFGCLFIIHFLSKDIFDVYIFDIISFIIFKVNTRFPANDKFVNSTLLFILLCVKGFDIFCFIYVFLEFSISLFNGLFFKWVIGIVFIKGIFMLFMLGFLFSKFVFSKKLLLLLLLLLLLKKLLLINFWVINSFSSFNLIYFSFNILFLSFNCFI